MSARVLGVFGIVLLAACSGDAPARRKDPDKLSSRGLYADIDARRVVAAAFEYTPDYALWSDGADKRRWLILPKGEQVDISDLAHWDFPLGTKLFKEFSRAGQLLETRLIERIKTTGRVKEDFFMGTFVWDEQQRDAVLEMDGHDNVNGSEHDVPAQKYCIVCHRGEPSGILGFSAVQLSASGTLSEASARGLLSEEPSRSYEVPGDDVQRPALGTLHANCGHCHADGATADFMHLRILPEEVDRPIEQLDIYKTSVGVMLSDEWKDRPAQFTTRIVPGDPEQSSILYRMQQRGDDALVPDQMPPIASRQVDDEAVAVVRAWIESLPAAAEPVADAGTEPDSGETTGQGMEPDSGKTEPEPVAHRMDAGVGQPTQGDSMPSTGEMPSPIMMDAGGPLDGKPTPGEAAAGSGAGAGMPAPADTSAADSGSAGTAGKVPAAGSGSAGTAGGVPAAGGGMSGAATSGVAGCSGESVACGAAGADADWDAAVPDSGADMDADSDEGTGEANEP